MLPEFLNLCVCVQFIFGLTRACGFEELLIKRKLNGKTDLHDSAMSKSLILRILFYLNEIHKHTEMGDWLLF